MQKVSDPRFSHFVAPPPLPVINDQSLRAYTWLDTRADDKLMCISEGLGLNRVTVNADIFMLYICSRCPCL